jgi:hypothetical protein
MREDIDVEPGHEDLLTQFLFEMSTPELDALRATTHQPAIRRC